MRPLVGLRHHFVPSEERTVGVAVATQSFAQALNGADNRYRYTLYCDPRARASIEQTLAPLSSNFKVAAHTALTQGERPSFLAWHENELDAFRAFVWRTQTGDRYPITLLHHSLSYKNFLHDTLLRLLLSRPQPYDAIICTSIPDACRK